MAHITFDRVREKSTTTGSGAFALAGALTGYRAFSDVAATNDTFYYTIAHYSLTEWEVGLGTYSALNTLTRTTVLASSNAGAAVVFSAGEKDVFLTAPASKFLQIDNTGSVGNFTAGVVTGTSFNSITGLASVNPLVDGTAAVGTSTLAARQDHVHPTDTSRAATNQTMYIGTTAVAINRASAALALTGITSIDGSAATLTTSRNINGVAFNGSADITVPSLYDTNYRRITNPGGAEYVTSTATVTGAIAITLPVGMVNSMLRVTIKVYEYVTNESFEIHAGGYNYSTGTTWVNNPFAYIVGNPGIDRRFTVRFGYTAGAKAVIYIGELASTWSYPQVFVTECQVGYSGHSVNYTTGWSIGFQASAFENVTATITNSQVGYAVSTNTANSTVLRDGSGNFSAGTITAALSGNATTATNISNSGTVTLATATESNSIYITAPSYSTDNPVKLLNFDWYGNLWSVGNIRSGGTPSNGFGVYYTASGGSRTEIARFNSSGYNLQVSGSFAATTKSFLINHPTKPGMKLRYGSLEGPENGVYVRGKLEGDVIELPDYWTKLVEPDSITVQLTPIGKHQKLYVKDIRDNKVYVGNDGVFSGAIKCFYYVLAERCDVDKLEVEI